MSSRTVRKLPLALLACAFLLTSLTACATSPKYVAAATGLPAVPAELRVCFDEVFKFPGKRGTGFSNEQAVAIIGGLRGSELEKTDCGRRLLAFYDDVATGRR
jgi:hypothetical protein